MMKEHECLIDTKSSAIAKKHQKKCDWDDEYDESIMKENSEEGTAPDYDSDLDDEQNKLMKI